jgi:hypothetical protein
MARLARISVTPVKGMALAHPEAADLTPHGIPGNRRFYLIDSGGELFSAFDHGPLVAIAPTYDREREHLSLHFPDDATVEGPADALGAPIRTNFHGRAVDGHLVEGPWSERLSAYANEPLRLVRTDHEGAGSDVEHLTIVTTASVTDLAARGRHDGPLDARRFRIDLEFEGTDPYEEDTWEGHQVQIGDATVQVLGQIPRCRVTTQSPETGQRDWSTLTQIAKYRPRIANDGGIPFGMYARVVEPATVHVGDRVVADNALPSGELPERAVRTRIPRTGV